MTTGITGPRKPSIFVKKINYWTIFNMGAVVYGSWLDIDFNRTGSNCLTIMKNEAPRSKLRGIKAELRRSQTRLRSDELRRSSTCPSSLQQAAGYSGEGE